MANDKVYIHELIDIIGHARAKYMQHMTANWCPIGRAERGQLCFGVWGTVGSTGRWPEVVNLWEEDGWDGLARSLTHETSHPGMQDPSLAAWWAEAAKYRRGGLDRILVPAPWMRTIEALCRDGVRGAFYAHEIVQLVPGGAREFLERVRVDAGLKSLIQAEMVTDAVFAALKEQLSPGEAGDIVAQLPRDLKSQWARA